MNVIRNFIREYLLNEDGEPYFVKNLSEFGKILASASRGGYSIYICSTLHSADRGLNRRGQKVVESPNGTLVKAGFWMDLPETSWGISELDYYRLPVQKRAQLEANEQVTRYNLRNTFMSHATPDYWRTQKITPEMVDRFEK